MSLRKISKFAAAREISSSTKKNKKITKMNTNTKNTTTTSEPPPLNQLRVLTYNVWFEGGFQRPASDNTPPSKEAPPNETLVQRGKRLMDLDCHASATTFRIRMEAIINILLELNPDVACLQEITPWSRDLVINNSRLTDIYSFSNNSVGRYGVLMLSKKILIPIFQTIPMPTNMGRDLLGVRVSLGNGRYATVHGAHYESLSSAPIRKEQLEVTVKSVGMTDEKNCNSGRNNVVVGDFNFCSYRNYVADDGAPLENHVLEEVMSEFDDLWPMLVWPRDDSGGDGDGGGGGGGGPPTTPRDDDKGWVSDA